MRTCIPLLAFLLLNCGSPPKERPPFEAARFDALLAMPQRDALFEIDALEPAENPASVVWWLTVQRNTSANIELRTRSAVAVAECGFAEGERFCLAVLGANLGEEFRESDTRHGLPQIDRWAFSREIALSWLRHRLLSANAEIPEYDVNFGAPQMRAAARAFASAIDAIPVLQPRIDADGLAQDVPEAPQVETVSAAAWTRARRDCLAACTPAEPKK